METAIDKAINCSEVRRYKKGMTREEVIRQILDTVLWTRNASDDNKNILIDALVEALEQEPCEDCISRKELDKALYERFHEEDSPNNITDVRLGAVRNFIKDFPSVTPQEPRWIPVSEKLSKLRTPVLCSEKGKVFIAAMTFEFKGTPNFGTHYYVDAWMPLPAPYEPQESEDKG